jgi:NTP pyrophosphatase (non-canonical NTP hydrolase)
MPERITDLTQIQQADYTWRSKVGLEVETIDDILPRFKQEVIELDEVLQNGRKREELASELADIGLMVISMMGSLGMDASALLTQKIDRNFSKYAPHEYNLLIEQGMQPREAMEHLKSSWNKELDKDFLKGI